LGGGYFFERKGCELEYSIRGKHYMADLYGVHDGLLDNLVFLEDLLINSAIVCGANVISSQHKKFEPSGVTVLVLLSESHISIHTYPDKGFASIDCYTCGEHIDPRKAIDVIIKMLAPAESYINGFDRGIYGKITPTE
jgi:S-adenosylmethionine decarboxylase